VIEQEYADIKIQGLVRANAPRLPGERPVVMRGAVAGDLDPRAS